MSEKSVFRVRLMRWGDSSSSGRTVTFKLPDDTDEHPFKGLPVGAKAGQLMEMDILFVEDDGEVETISQPMRKPAAQHPPMKKPQKRLAARADDSRSAITSRATPEPTYEHIKPESEQYEGHDRGGVGSASPVTSTDETEPVPPSVATKSRDLEPNESSTSPALDNENLGAYAGKMGMAAEALAAVAEKITGDTDQDDVDQTESDEPTESAAEINGRKLVARASNLCKAVDNHRSGFFYFMQSMYPRVNPLPPEEGQWSRDSKVTRDRVCHHCETIALEGLAEDDTARERFEELEMQFERSERFR